MNNRCSKKKHNIIAIVILFVCLLPSLIIYATGSESTQGADGKTYTYSTEDDGTDGPDVKTLEFELTGYGGNLLGSGKVSSDFTTNSKYGWSEFEKDGQKYVVLAAATHEMLSSNKGRTGTYWFYGAKFDHIHYFHYYDTVQFKFDDSFDSQVYNGIILDSGDAMMFPQHDLYKRKSGINMFDVYFGDNGESASGVSKISGQVVSVSSDGTFSSNAGTKSSTSTRSTFIEYATQFFSFVGDLIQTVIDFSATEMSWSDSKKLTYSKSDIEADDDLNDSIQVGESSSSSDTTDTSTENKGTSKIRNVDISSIVDNRKGEKETVYTSSTEIPVMPIDMYSSSIDIVDMFDIDFFSSSSENTDKFWNVLRSATRTISHMVMYISAALMLSLIIWRSILLVKSSLGDEPEEAFGSKKIMDDLVRSVLIISFVYFIMIILMNFYKEILSEVLKIVVGNNESIYLIKVNVDGVYSFNTNVIGYLKYLSLTTNEIGAFVYSILYALVQVFGNLLWFMLMFARTVLIAVLIMIAPLAAVYNMTNRTKKGGSYFTNILDFRTLMRLYVLALFIPLVGILMYKVILVFA